MEIIVVSDTHNSMEAMEKILEISKNSDVIIHLGDNIDDARYLEKNFNGSVYMVKGNCDYGKEGENEQLIELCGKKFFITHGDRYGVNYGLDKIYYKGLELNADFIMFGHTHKKVLIEEGGIYILNPGSIPLPRDNSKSYIKIDILLDDNIEVDIIEIK